MILIWKKDELLQDDIKKSRNSSYSVLNINSLLQVYYLSVHTNLTLTVWWAEENCVQYNINVYSLLQLYFLTVHAINSVMSWRVMSIIYLNVHFLLQVYFLTVHAILPFNSVMSWRVKCKPWAIRSGCSWLKSKWANHSFFEQIAYLLFCSHKPSNLLRKNLNKIIFLKFCIFFKFRSFPLL